MEMRDFRGGNVREGSMGIETHRSESSQSKQSEASKSSGLATAWIVGRYTQNIRIRDTFGSPVKGVDIRMAVHSAEKNKVFGIRGRLDFEPWFSHHIC